MLAKTQNLSPSPNIKLENLGSHLFCSITYSGKNWECNISSDELRSGMLSLLKLQNILKSYETIIQNPHYQFKFEIYENERTCTKHLILHIVFSDDYIDWEEKIYFREKCIVEQEIVENNLLKQQVQIQQKQIEKLENIIQNLEKRLDIVEKDILIEVIYNDVNYSNEIRKLLPKKMDKLRIYETDNVHNRLYGIQLTYKNKYNETIKESISTRKEDLDSSGSRLPKITPFLKKIVEFDCDEVFFSHIDFNYDFLDFYLSYKKTVFVIKLESAHSCYLKKYLDVLVKHTNYKKLIFPYNKEFNDVELKTHCDTNGIEYIYE